MRSLSIMVKPVSGLCNMRCGYCFYADEMAHRQTPLHAAMASKTLEDLLRRAFAYASGPIYLSFQGGEPTLAGAGFYRDLLALEKMYNTRRIPVHHAIQSNGLHMEEDLLPVLREGRFLVGLSLDGTRAIHDSRRLDNKGRGTHERVVQTAKRLREAGLAYNILCVVDRMVAKRPQEVFDALAAHTFLQFIPCLDPLCGATGENSLNARDYGRFLSVLYRNYARELRGGRLISIRAFDNWLGMLAGYPPESCGFSGGCAPNYLVESNGDVYPCDFYALDEWRLGNIGDSSFFSLEKSKVHADFRARSRLVDAECRSCGYLSVCRGGCFRDREPALPNGRPPQNRLCEGYRAFFGENIEDMKRLCRQMLAHAP